LARINISIRLVEMQDNESNFAENEPLTTLVCGAPRLVYPGENFPFESPSLGEFSIATIVLEDFLELKLQLKNIEY
jgi:hypothetical protein